MAWSTCWGCFAMIKGITVKLIPQVEVGEDSFGTAVYKDGDPVEVDNVLVGPVTTAENLEITNLYGKTAEYQIAIPKGDTHVWKDQVVEFFGKRWKVFSLPQEGIDDMIPLGWNAKYSVERFE